MPREAGYLPGTFQTASQRDTGFHRIPALGWVLLGWVNSYPWRQWESWKIWRFSAKEVCWQENQLGDQWHSKGWHGEGHGWGWWSFQKIADMDVSMTLREGEAGQVRRGVVEGYLSVFSAHQKVQNRLTGSHPVARGQTGVWHAIWKGTLELSLGVNTLFLSPVLQGKEQHHGQGWLKVHPQGG
jgi:hypothetical protein